MGKVWTVVKWFGALVGKSIRRFGRSSGETKTATLGALIFGGLGLLFGPDVTIAAAGSDLSGSVVLSLLGAFVGALLGYSVFKKATAGKSPAASPDRQP
jgi:hypothetical protein